MGGRFLLKAVVKGVRLLVDLGLSVRRASRGTSFVFLSWFAVSFLGYPLACSLLAMSCMAVVASFGFEHIFFALKNWPNGMFCICLSGWYEV